MSNDKVILRAKIQALADFDLSNYEIAGRLKTSEATVRRWRHKKTVRDKSRSGRPTILTPTTKDNIERNERSIGVICSKMRQKFEL